MESKKFTTAMLAKIDEAASLAVFAKNPEITPLHILWAIAADSQSPLAQFLARRNIAAAAVIEHLRAAAERLPKASNASAGNLRLSAAANDALAAAMGAALAAGDEYLSVDLYLRAEANRSVAEHLSDFFAPAELAAELAERRAGRKVTDAAADADGSGVLEQFCTDLTALARAGKLDPITGRDAELERCMSILLRKSKNNPILLGEPGVGKTAIAEALAQAIADEKVPQSLARKQILVLSMSDLLAGAKYRGEFEERMSKLIAEVKQRPDVIIFIDEIHTILGAGDAEGGAGDAAQMLKPALSRGEFCTIGATTLGEYKKFFEKDPALQRRFAPVYVAEPSVPQAIAMLRGLRERLCAHHRVSIQDAALVAAAKLSDKFIQGRFLPDKAIDLIDEACAELKMQIESEPAPLRSLGAKIAALKTEREALRMEHSAATGEAADGDKPAATEGANSARLAALEAELANACEQERQLRAQLANEQEVFGQISELLADIDSATTKAAVAKQQGDFSLAGELEYGRIPQLREQLKAAQQRWAALSAAGTLLKNEVDAEAVAQVLERATGIPAGAMLAAEREKLAALEANLSAQVIAQSEAIAAIARAIKINKAGLGEANKPIGSFLFAGPTGVGKTELAKALARELFGDERQIIRFDMNEYAEEFRISQLIGSSRGYVGSEQGGLLTEAVRAKPYSIVLFDEIEKAHPKIFNVFLNLLDEGALKDNAGNLVSFKNCVVIFTSNAGAVEVAAARRTGGPTREVLSAALGAYFRPEFLNRLSEIVSFNALDEAAAEQIAAMKIAALAARLEEQNLRLEADSSAARAIARAGFSAEYGARAIARAVARLLEAPLAEAIIRGEFTHTAVVRAAPAGSADAGATGAAAASELQITYK